MLFATYGCKRDQKNEHSGNNDASTSKANEKVTENPKENPNGPLSSSESSNSLSSSDSLNGGESGGGSIIGNSMLAYSSKSLGISFKYPSNWKLEEKIDEKKSTVILSNQKIEDNNPNTVSIIFNLQEILNGKTFRDQEELKNYLEGLKPSGCDINIMNRRPVPSTQNEYPSLVLDNNTIASYALIDGQEDIKVLNITPAELKGTVIENINFDLNQKTHLSKEQCNFIMSKGAHIIPVVRWNKTKMVGKMGYWREEIKYNLHIAEYYLLDENYNILTINYRTNKLVDNEQIILSIIKSLSIDDEGPILEYAYFEPAQAHPGETVKLVVLASDEISGLDVSKIGLDSAIPSSNYLLPTSKLGYNLQHDSLQLGLWNAYPLYKGFKQLDSTRIEYTFTIPQNAPTGTISLSHLVLVDVKANRNWYECEPFTGFFEDYYSYHERSSTAKKATKIVRADLTVLPPTAPEAFEDREAPIVEKIFLSTTFLYKDQPIQKVFVKAKDPSGISNIILSLSTRKYGDNYENRIDCSEGVVVDHDNRNGRLNKKPWKKEDGDIFSKEIDFSNCWDYGSVYNNFDLVYVKIESIFDTVGNQSYLSEYIDGHPTAHFQIMH